jgi:hypothetical protein
MVAEARKMFGHGSRPSGAKGFLLGAELIARNLPDFSRDQPSLVRELTILGWAESDKVVWPPRALPASVMVADAVAAVYDPRRHSADWYKALNEDSERRVAEEQ